MSLSKLITALTLATALLVMAMPTPALAETMEQHQKLEQEIECTASGYGQSRCYAKQTGEQSQKIEGFIRADGKFVKFHKPVDTGLDTLTLAAVAGTLITGIGAAVVKFKSR